MESSRLNITKEKSPTLIFKNKTISDLDVGDKGQLEVDIDVISQSLSMDENDNEVMRYTLGVVKASKLNIKEARA